MAEIQVSNIEEGQTHFDAIARTDDDFPNMVEHVEIINCSGEQAGKVSYEGDPAQARSVFPVLMAKLDDAVFEAATKAQEETISWSGVDFELIEP